MRAAPTLLRSGTALVLGAALLGACSDQAAERTPLGSGPSSASQAAISEEAALVELTRITALALQDQGLRQRVRNDLRESRHTHEHKLHFTNYLNGQSGGILLAKMARESGKSRAEVLELISAVRPLEFYMPVREHRATWRGGDDLFLASLLEDEGRTPYGFDLSGRPVQLSAHTPPATPVLSLTPVETDFTRPLSAAEYRNADDRGGETIGTWVPGGTGPSFAMAVDDCSYDYSIDTCSDDGGGGGGGGGGTTTKPGGLYMTYSYVSNDGEAWTKGNPEIEVHIHGPNGGDKTYGADLACAGEKQTDYYRNFNQDSKTWSGEVLLFNQQQITDYVTKYGDQGFNVMMWEDDDTACTIKTDKDMTSVLGGIAAALGAAAVVIKKDPTWGDWVKAAGLFVGAVYASASWLKSNDDFLGAAPQLQLNATRTDLYTSGSTSNGYIYTSLKYMQ